ncbi:aminoacetone oxidase family FAD-binding enzyme [Lachnoclostridium sp. An169]|uniref:NAD(P)/FAD-dependent oxidoreductase n=1 Tax=Lachnoclostridium sp. An169 TaxID=1965569 RepID=UPI000B3AE855|nr:NAD(P)/FAD-dependent oxidoreductase [Lachnoclostridium sp. An169]OUP83088.1 aminoacetone oxidase family FAD-binding enzyme [Lachnoclostridium sp. An169]
MRTVTVVGGGASGMMAAITAAECGVRVILLEHNARVGKKILSTGNGRCNFTNIHQESLCYRSEDPLFPWGIIQKFSAQDTIAFFLKLGIYSKNRNGYLYPNSDQASAVLDVLRMELSRLNVDVRTEQECLEIRPVHPSRGKHSSQEDSAGFSVRTDKESFFTDRVILCAGSKAAPSSGSDGSGYSLAKKLGHHLIPVLPALVQLRCRENFFKSIAGVRADGKVSVFAGEELLASDRGEIQLTDYGISGIPVFQVSRFVSRALYEKEEVTVRLDFMPDHTQEQFAQFLKSRIRMRPDKTLEQFFTGLFHKKLSDLWIRLSGIPRTKTVEKLTEDEIETLVRLVKQFRVTVLRTNSFEQAQVCCGGVDTAEVNPDTLESLLVPGLYFAGEILDVDGMCGGYNLQWAWSSGHRAGEEAAHA